MQAYFGFEPDFRAHDSNPEPRLVPSLQLRPSIHLEMSPIVSSRDQRKKIGETMTRWKLTPIKFKAGNGFFPDWSKTDFGNWPKLFRNCVGQVRQSAPVAAWSRCLEELSSNLSLKNFPTMLLIHSVNDEGLEPSSAALQRICKVCY